MTKFFLPAFTVTALILGTAWSHAIAAPSRGAVIVGGAGPAAQRGEMKPPWPYRPKEFAFVHDAGVFHVFYMMTDMTKPMKETEKEFGHAISTDLLNWTQLPPVLHVQPGTWDSSHTWAPTIIKGGDTWYLFYAGVQDLPFQWPFFQRIGVATSTDLMNWTHHDEPVYTGNMVPWAVADSSQFDGAQFRDPFVMEDPENPGKWLMYYVTMPDAARGQLLIGAARNDGGLSPWQDVGPLWCTDNAHGWGWNESPHLFEHDGLWYLFTSLNALHSINFRVGPSPLADSLLWSESYRIYDFTGGSSRNSTAWFGVEYLSVNGHDYFAYIDTEFNVLCFEEIAWGTPPDFFTLQGPPVVVGIGGDGEAPGVSLRAVGPARLGSGVVFAAVLPAAMEARLEIYDLRGGRLCVPHSGVLPAGESALHWDSRDQAGDVVPRGMYFARLSTGAGTAIAKVALTE